MSFVMTLTAIHVRQVSLISVRNALTIVQSLLMEFVHAVLERSLAPMELVINVLSLIVWNVMKKTPQNVCNVKKA